MKPTLLYLAFAAACITTLLAFTAGETWTGLLAATTGVLVMSAVVFGKDSK